VPQAGGGVPPLELPEVEEELLPELELDPVPAIPVLLDPVPAIPVVLELLLEVLVLELELELPLEVPVEVSEPVVLPDVLVPVLAPEEEEPEVVVAVEWEPFPCAVDPPPANIAMASSEGSVPRSTRPGTSSGVFTSARTNSFLPL